MRLLDGHRLAGLGLPVRGEGLVVFLVEFACRVIGHVEDGRVGERETEAPNWTDAGDQAGEQFA